MLRAVNLPSVGTQAVVSQVSSWITARRSISPVVLTSAAGDIDRCRGCRGPIPDHQQRAGKWAQELA